MFESIIIALGANLDRIESIPKNHTKKREEVDKSGALYHSLVKYLIGPDGYELGWNCIKEWDGQSVYFETGGSLLPSRDYFESTVGQFTVDEAVLDGLSIIKVGAL